MKDINAVLTADARGFPVQFNKAICMLDVYRKYLVPSSHSQNRADQIDQNIDLMPTGFDFESELRAIPGVSALMQFVFGENGIRSIEDLADCCSDDLDGWNELKGGKTIRHAGILYRFGVSRKDCEAIIINARAKAGWFK